jgi:small subunit ribosomal protein S6
MHKYELMYIVRPDVEEEVLKSTRERLQAVITENGGELLETNDLGKRRLAYVINHDGKKFREGYYTVTTFNGEGKVVSELDRVIGINDNVIRHITINIDEK